VKSEEERVSKKARLMVEDPHAHQGIRTARGLADAANAEQSLQGYAAVNGLGEDDEIARLAYEFFREREQSGAEGTADDDWFRAEAEVRRRRGPASM
jgi:hypothetical protein